MSATSRNKYPGYSMPSSSNDRSQQGFASNIYPNNNQDIWSSSLSNARERSISSNLDEHPSGSSALNANSEADVAWNKVPWKAQNPSPPLSTSPNQTRDAGISNGRDIYDGSLSTLSLGNGGFGGNDTTGYGSVYPMGQRRGSSQENPYSVPTQPQRQSQASPAYPERYPGHTPSNSIHSQRPMASHSSSFQNQPASSQNPSSSYQSVNQRAFEYNNNQILAEDRAFPYSRRMAADNPAVNGGSIFNPASVPFQARASPQNWQNEAASSRYSNSMDLPESLVIQAINRGIDRIVPNSGYRPEPSNSHQAFSTPDWNPRISSSQHPRQSEPEGRPYLPYPIYPTQNAYHYANTAAHLPPNMMDPYHAGYRSFPYASLQSVPQSSLGNNVPVRSSYDPELRRSPLLDDFRSSKSKKFELRDLYGHMVEFSGDQHGSRFIQTKLESANSDEKDRVFNEIKSNVSALMKDVFGNYVIQKFFEHGSQVQKGFLADTIKGKAADLSTQVYACRVVQKALEHVLVEQQAEITQALRPDIMRVIKDQNGNHVVQKIIEVVPRQYIGFIVDAVHNQVATLSQHAFACRIIQRLLEHGTEEDKANIMAELHGASQVLITDQYGNYVAQHVIENGAPEDRQRLIRLVLSQLLTLSKHKFASNVVELCIVFGTAEQRTAIRKQFTEAGKDGVSPLPSILKDQYGNYVIQKLVDQLRDEERATLVEQIKPYFLVMKKSGSGSTSRQLMVLEKLLESGSGNGKTEVPTESSLPTPVLTNETNSPQSSSPASSKVKTSAAPVEGDGKTVMTNGIAPQVQDEEA